MSCNYFPSIPTARQGIYRYSYVKNDPINYSDPSGHESLTGGKTKAVTYVVQSGEGFIAIAAKLADMGLKVTPEQIFQQNQGVRGVIGKNLVWVDITLTITGEDTSSSSTSTSTASATTASAPSNTKDPKNDAQPAWWQISPEESAAMSRNAEEQLKLQIARDIANNEQNLTPSTETGTPPTSNPPRIQQPSVDVAAIHETYANNSPKKLNLGSPEYVATPRVYEDGVRPRDLSQESRDLEASFQSQQTRSIAKSIVKDVTGINDFVAVADGKANWKNFASLAVLAISVVPGGAIVKVGQGLRAAELGLPPGRGYL